MRSSCQLGDHDGGEVRESGLGFKTSSLRQTVGRSLRINPDEADAHNNLGDVAFEQGRFADAAACYRAALRVGPDLVEAHQNLGMSLVALGRPGEAMKLAERAVELTNRKDAESWIRLRRPMRKLATPTAASQPELAGQIEKRLQAFQSNRPWREP